MDQFRSLLASVAANQNDSVLSEELRPVRAPLTPSERMGLAMLRSGCSFADAANGAGIDVARLMGLYACTPSGRSVRSPAKAVKSQGRGGQAGLSLPELRRGADPFDRNPICLPQAPAGRGFSSSLPDVGLSQE